MSHTRAHRRAAGQGPPPNRPQRYEDLGLLAGFPTVYDTFTKTWIVRIHDDQVRFDRQAVTDTTDLMHALHQDGTRRDQENPS